MNKRKMFGSMAVIGITIVMILCISSYSIHTGMAGSYNLTKAAKKEIPEITDVKKSLNIISKLNNEDTWTSGKFDKTRKSIAADNTYLSLNCSLSIESSQYRVLVNDNSYRIIVNKFNKKNKHLGAADLCNGDILNLGASVRYITVTIYKYENRQKSKSDYRDILSDFKSGLELSVTKITDLGQHAADKELLTAEVHIESLSNGGNYRTGWFKSWGGKYENLDGTICSRNYYKVDSKPYIFNVNDSRISLSITEYDAKGNWVKFNGPLLNGDTFKKQSKTSYIGISLKSLKWGVDLYSLFEEGLRVDLASKQYISETPTQSFNPIELSDKDNWKTGAYLYETGERIIDPDKICYKTFHRMDTKEYVVNLPGGYLKMNIIELNRDGKAIISSDLQSGQKWKKSKDTDKIAITVYGYDKAFSPADYKKAISDYPAFGLEEYVRYAHNTTMKEITAGEFVNAINVGWNLGNSLDSYSKTSSKKINLMQEQYWGNPYITKDLINYVADCGFNTIRIPVTWYYNTYVDKDGNLKINKEWLDRVQEVVDYAMAKGLYVIINTHHEQPIIYAGTNDADMKQVLKNAKALWTDIAEQFKTYDEHLIFEAYNEVDNIENYWNYGDKAATQMNELNQLFVDTVRSTGGNNAKRILVVPTLLDRMDARFYSAFRMPEDIVEDKIAVQVHTYSQKFHQAIDCDFAELEEFSNKIKAPIIIGEFGSTTSYPFPELRTEHASNFVARAAAHGIKCIWWDNGSEYGIIDRRDFSASDKKMIKALLDGAKRIGYRLEQEIVLNSLEQFVNRMPNTNTGELEIRSWRTLTSDVEGSAIRITEGTICAVSLKAVHEAAGIWLQRLLFYDADGKLVQAGKEIQSKYYNCKVPEGAVTARISINSPTVNISLNDYEKYLDSGDLEVSICFFNTKDMKKVKVPVKKFKSE